MAASGQQLKTEITYTLDGCTGQLVTTERTNRPSPLALLGLTLFLGLSLAALLLEPFTLLFVWCGFAALLFGRTDSRRNPERESQSHEWVWQKRKVARPLRIEGTHLHYRAGDEAIHVDLRGAEIRASEVGVFVTIGGFDPIELYWDDATRSEAEALANAMREVADDSRDRGDRLDVPESLATLRT